jgi:Response regulator receiver domain
MSDKLSVLSPSQQVSVLVVDDADVIRRTLRSFLKGEPAIKLLGEASNFAEAISMTAALKPDVILLDLHMPDDRSFNPEFVKAKLPQGSGQKRPTGIMSKPANGCGPGLGSFTPSSLDPASLFSFSSSSVHISGCDRGAAGGRAWR